MAESEVHRHLSDASRHATEALSALYQLRPSREGWRTVIPADGARCGHKGCTKTIPCPDHGHLAHWVRDDDRNDPTTDKGCRSCRRAKDSHGRPLYVDSRTPGSDLCRNCQDWTRQKGQWPALGIVEAWRDGKRLTTAIVARAEADARHHANTKRKKRRAS